MSTEDRLRELERWQRRRNMPLWYEVFESLAVLAVVGIVARILYLNPGLLFGH